MTERGKKQEERNGPKPSRKPVKPASKEAAPGQPKVQSAEKQPRDTAARERQGEASAAARKRPPEISARGGRPKGESPAAGATAGAPGPAARRGAGGRDEDAAGGNGAGRRREKRARVTDGADLPSAASTAAKPAAAPKPAPRPRSRASLELSKAKKSHFDEGSLDQYLKEISQYPLITREEEVELAKRIKKGDQAALEKLCRSNLRFVVSVAKKYQNQGVSLADLINEGNLGLIRAAHKFDETKGIKFISYAVWWIRQAILQALAEQSRIVRVPLNRAGTLHRIGKKSNSLLQELGREPTVEEIAEGMDISLDEVRKTMSISQSHLSLDAPLTPGEDNKLLDYLPDEYNPSPDDNAFERALGEAIQDSLETLKPREAKILKLYYGLDNQEAMTLEEIGSVLGITRERVRQIKEKALSRLRHVSRARALQSFLT